MCLAVFCLVIYQSHVHISYLPQSQLLVFILQVRGHCFSIYRRRYPPRLFSHSPPPNKVTISLDCCLVYMTVFCMVLVLIFLFSNYRNVVKMTKIPFLMLVFFGILMSYVEAACISTPCKCFGFSKGLHCGDGNYGCEIGHVYQCNDRGERSCDYGLRDSCQLCNNLACE